MKGLKLVALVGLLLVAGAAWGQVDSLWSRIYGGEANAKCTSIVQTTDGGFALAGYIIDEEGSDFLLLKTNEHGDTLWSRTFVADVWAGFVSIIQTFDGGLLVSGSSDSTLDTPNDRDIVLIKYSAQGDLLWSRTLGSPGDDYQKALIETSDSCIALSGLSEGFAPYAQNFFLLKLTAEGDSILSKEYQVGEMESFCSCLIQTADHGFLLGGYINRAAGWPTDFWALRASEDGDSLWSYAYEFGDFDSFEMCRQIVELDEGGFVLAGNANPGNDQILLIRINEVGEQLWAREYGGEAEDYCNDMTITQDRKLALAGATTSFGAGGSDMYMLKVDENGDSLWAATFGGRGNEHAERIIQTSDGGFVLVGSTGSAIWLVKTTPDPVSVRQSTDFPATFTLSPAFPNPFNSSTRIEFGMQRVGTARLEVFDPLGRKVKELLPGSMLSAGSHTVSWDAEGLPSGRYLIRLKTAEGEQTARSAVLIK